ncbi:MAG: hypothetical protein ACLPGW_08540, partial [Roseiarcus sp.]
KRREEDEMEPTNGAESEATGTGASAGAPLPRAVGLPARPELEGEVERNPIFDALVGSDEEDVAGLVAYSIYKQNKRAWLDDFVKTTGHAPNEAETRSYIIGESTERRLATYRRLASSTLAGDAPSRSVRRANAQMSRTAAGALWALALIVALGVVGLAIHAGYFTGAK